MSQVPQLDEATTAAWQQAGWKLQESQSCSRCGRTPVFSKLEIIEKKIGDHTGASFSCNPLLWLVFLATNAAAKAIAPPKIITLNIDHYACPHCKHEWGANEREVGIKRL
jgi:hypothetical protein